MNTMHHLVILTVLTAVAAAATPAVAQDKGCKDCPFRAEHTKGSTAGHYSRVNKHGDKTMGFGHTVTTHHFHLAKDGGSIAVSADDAHDKTTREQIRTHLQHITKAFAAGDFQMPKAVHGRMPPGADGMAKLRAQLAYRYEETRNGGKVVISTTDADALSAVHKFLRFQIQDHRTGDSTVVASK